jgi:hypothetical protein
MKHLIWAAALLAATPCLAQEEEPVNRVFVGRAMQGPGGPPMLDHLMVLGAEEGFELKTVKGAPYQAEAVTEVVQSLADGNRITRKTTSSVARDGEGRVRRESLLAGLGPLALGDGPKLVFIHDPVAKTGYVLDLEDKTARKLPAPRAEAVSAGPGGPHGGPGPHRPPAEWTQKVDGPGPGPVMKFKQRVKELPAGKKEDLGSQTIEGVPAKGTRTTHTIPAGQIGNDRAIEIVHERWYSDELQAVVMSRHADPRMGETTYRLTGIQRGEPDASLFQVPDDFKLEEGAPRFKKRVEKVKDKSN